MFLKIRLQALSLWKSDFLNLFCQKKTIWSTWQYQILEGIYGWGHIMMNDQLLNWKLRKNYDRDMKWLFFFFNTLYLHNNWIFWNALKIFGSMIDTFLDLYSRLAFIMYYLKAKLDLPSRKSIYKNIFKIFISFETI